jgi:hypothetical protein
MDMLTKSVLVLKFKHCFDLWGDLHWGLDEIQVKVEVCRVWIDFLKSRGAQPDGFFSL